MADCLRNNRERSATPTFQPVKRDFLILSSDEQVLDAIFIRIEADILDTRCMGKGLQEFHILVDVSTQDGAYGLGTLTTA